MSENLKAFLTAWLQWIDAGANDVHPFRRDRGLCNQFEGWIYAQGFDYDAADGEFAAFAKLLFRETGHCDYPFGGKVAYELERDKKRMHLNPARIAWVRSKIAQKQEA